MKDAPTIVGLWLDGDAVSVDVREGWALTRDEADALYGAARAAGLGAKAKEGVDGVDFTPVLRNPGAKLSREALYFHYPHYYQTTTPVSAVRKGDWKLLEYFEDGRVELFNLKKDLGEKTDLSTAQPEIAKRLAAELRAWRQEVGALVPEPNPARQPKRK